MSNVRLIAKQAGVSISSVSRVLNNQPGVSESVRAAVLAAVNEAGYVPEVGRRSTTNVALIYTHVPTLESPFDAALLSGIYAGLAANGWDLVILEVHRSRQPGETVTQMLLRKGVQGALMRTTTPTQGVCREVAVEGFPAVIVGSRPTAPGRASCTATRARRAARRLSICSISGTGGSWPRPTLWTTPTTPIGSRATARGTGGPGRPLRRVPRPAGAGRNRGRGTGDPAIGDDDAAADRGVPGRPAHRSRRGGRGAAGGAGGSSRICRWSGSTTRTYGPPLRRN